MRWGERSKAFEFTSVISETENKVALLQRSVLGTSQTSGYNSEIFTLFIFSIGVNFFRIVTLRFKK